ncbi:hypothetical protein [Streptomyces sp. NPDC086777]|uniref:hypothetical protein n=1 Tax=Streptomyces sp. NPDC086777 TaxID=3154866 RepID=UPI00344F0ED4
MKTLRAFVRFWIDFIVGDDWKITAAVAVALGLVIGALREGSLGETGLTVLGGVLLPASFAVSLVIDVRRNREP